MSLTDTLFANLFSEKAKSLSERIIVRLALAGFVIHLIIIGLVDFGYYQVNDRDGLLSNPISSLYTPFSFVLVYEVYLLVFYLPQSFTKYIGKQYEIISLIVIRRIFKDLAELELNASFFQNHNDIRFMYNVFTVILLFLLIYFFYRLNAYPSPQTNAAEVNDRTIAFIYTKKRISLILFQILVILTIYSLLNWAKNNFFSAKQLLSAVSDINKIFFDQFFTILILTDVLLLLISFEHSDRFSTVMRNSGFVISTVLIKLSFGATGFINNMLILTAVLFGVIMLWIYRRYHRIESELDA